MELPIINTVDIRGYKIVIRAIPFTLAMRMNQNKGDAQAQIAASAEYVSKYCTYEDGSPLDLDCLTIDDVSHLVNTALGVSSTDFQQKLIA